jgi:Ser/Thr protein kinase RdoA (MazF antagonist)
METHLPYLQQVGRYIFEGYSSVIELSEVELRMLYDIAIARYTLEITIGNKEIHSGAANEYIKTCTANVTACLQNLSNVGRETFNNVIVGI